MSPIYISLAALLVSIAGFGLSLCTARRNARFQRAQTRNGLLLKVLNLRLDYARFIRRLRDIKASPPGPISKEAQEIIAAEPLFHQWEHMTESYRQALLGPKAKLDAVTLLELEYRIDSLTREMGEKSAHFEEMLK